MLTKAGLSPRSSDNTLSRSRTATMRGRAIALRTFAMLEMASTCRVGSYSATYGNKLEPAHTGELAALTDAGIN